MAQQDPNPPPEAIVFGQFGGIRNTVTPERLTANDLEKAVNVDIDDAGQVRRRRGYSKVDLEAWHSLRTIGGKTYGVRNGSLVIVRDNYDVMALQGAPGPLCFTEVDGDVYFSGSVAGIVTPQETIIPWGAIDGQGQWLSPVVVPTETLGAISGKLVGPPPIASCIEAYKGRIYLAVDKVLWATDLYRYHYVDKTRNFLQFEHEITLLEAMDDGLYVGTTGGLYFIQGVLGSFKLSQVTTTHVLPGSGVRVPTDLVHPNARNGPMPTGEALVLMTNEGILACFDGGNAFNLTHDRVIFPEGISAAALFRQDLGANSYVAAVDSAGGPSANTRIGDYVDAEIVRPIRT